MSLATLERQSPAAEETDPAPLKVAYIVSRFPKLTETFVLYEILALQERGVDVSVFPLLSLENASSRQGASLLGKVLELVKKPTGKAVMHREAEPLIKLASYYPLVSWKILLAQVYYLLRKPRAYFGALWSLIRGNWGSRKFLLGGLAIFPKTVLIAREAQRRKITHLHAHFANHPAAAAFVVRRLTGIGYSFTAHGSDLHVDRHMLREKVQEADQVVTISGYNREMIVEECGEEFRDKIHVVHCGVDTAVFSPAEREVPTTGAGSPSHFVETGRLAVVCVGTMHEVKGQAYLLEACRLLRDRGTDVTCHLVGTGPDEPELRRQVDEAGLGERVVFHGLLTRDEIAALLGRSDVLAAPSVLTSDGRREGIPVVLMEAMASGLPVVSSQLSGIPELVEHDKSGLLVPPRDAEGLAEALQRLADDPELRSRLADGGRETVLREFDLSRNAATLVDLFCETHS